VPDGDCSGIEFLICIDGTCKHAGGGDMNGVFGGRHPIWLSGLRGVIERPAVAVHR
jgi:hypothetical protein